MGRVDNQSPVIGQPPVVHRDVVGLATQFGSSQVLLPAP